MVAACINKFAAPVVQSHEAQVNLLGLLTALSALVIAEAKPHRLHSHVITHVSSCVAQCHVTIGLLRALYVHSIICMHKMHSAATLVRSLPSLSWAARRKCNPSPS